MSASPRLRACWAFLTSWLIVLGATGLMAQAAGASSGGSGLGGGTDTSSPAATQTPQTSNATTTSTTTTSTTTTTSSSSGGTPNVTLGATVPGVTVLLGTQQVAGDGITLTISRFGELGQVVNVSGEAPPADAGATIDIDGISAQAGATWSDLATATVAADGSFQTVWVPTSSASFTLQATLGPNPSQAAGAPQTGGGALPDAETAASALTGTASFAFPVFRLSTATLYGPGFWGHRTACGEVLRRTTLGVANRTLRCGTMVAVYFGGRELSVPVIDRGPFTNHASWDLTEAVAKALHMTQTSQVGTLAPAPAALAAATRRGG